MQKPGTKITIGKERLKSDMRQLGGMLMLTGVPALVFPMASVASAVGMDADVENGIPFVGLLAGIFVIIMGLMSVPTGCMQAVHDCGNKHLTGFLILFAQLAWVPFITDLTAVGRGAREGAPFIPSILEPTASDTKVVGAMGMLGVLCHGVGFLGSLAFIQFSLHACQSGNPGDRPGSYFRARLRMCAFVNLLGGFAQLFLGACICSNFGSGPLPAPVSVAMCFIHFPEISMAVGSLQALNSLYGLARSMGIMDTGNWFQVTTLFQWWATVVLQILVQVAYAPAGDAAAKAPSQTMLTMGVNMMIAYLDCKMRNTPESLPKGHHGEDVAFPEDSVDFGESEKEEADDVCGDEAA